MKLLTGSYVGCTMIARRMSAKHFPLLRTCEAADIQHNSIRNTAGSAACGTHLVAGLAGAGVGQRGALRVAVVVGGRHLGCVVAAVVWLAAPALERVAQPQPVRRSSKC